MTSERNVFAMCCAVLFACELSLLQWCVQRRPSSTCVATEERCVPSGYLMPTAFCDEKCCVSSAGVCSEFPLVSVHLIGRPRQGVGLRRGEGAGAPPLGDLVTGPSEARGEGRGGEEEGGN
ncbi:hypothetical protein NDU88_003635 [Pleurodeles waltl]|uniref:Secreted protein n=1 Tax=Pleurodeles waltl TaxID=8319 RepID=A0AAV7TR61_PLEWA|nr:hypothetical protein NDU88_003635 [Pleurodeles waltl]